MSIVLKVKISGNLYRIQVAADEAGVVASYEAIVEAVAKVWPPGSGEAVVKYLDDEDDLCTLCPLTFPDFLVVSSSKGGKYQVVVSAKTPAPVPGESVQASQQRERCPWGEHWARHMKAHWAAHHAAMKRHGGSHHAAMYKHWAGHHAALHRHWQSWLAGHDLTHRHCGHARSRHANGPVCQRNEYEPSAPPAEQEEKVSEPARSDLAFPVEAATEATNKEAEWEVLAEHAKGEDKVPMSETETDQPALDRDEGTEAKQPCDLGNSAEDKPSTGSTEDQKSVNSAEDKPSATEEVKRCPGGCGYLVTWHATHCCAACKLSGKHGPRCNRQLARDSECAGS
mmetsp:Transcript_105400/g.272856  ORF Transcript_105400/g.272856 Transcript_105400/m.272856 type:complete len:340 (-) Transcript_105400:440-1459(-)